MNPLLELREHGQSYWLDNLTRGMIRSGELERRISEEGLRGITSNPAIFQKAISQGREYDEEIDRLSRRGLSTSDIYDRVVVSDIQAACDLLRPVYEESGGHDGFVSLEVSPYLAHDTEGSLEEARRLFRLVDRKNVLIKIPGTDAGVPAIEEALFEGISVNITLLFSIRAYEAVAEAYVRALERRAEAGLGVDEVASVASFFLSRIDVLVDRLLAHRLVPDADRGEGAGPERLFGRAAVANAKLAYQSFVGRQKTARWRALAEQGARPQRLLWASTSTKDPLYSDVRYVEPLIGPETVNTMPEQTIRAFADHGRVRHTVEEGLDDARAVMEGLAEVGIEVDRVTAQLEDEGVQKFIDPFDKLMGTLADRRREALGGCLTGQRESLGSLESGLKGVLSSLDGRQFGRRLAARDPSLWSDRPEAWDRIGERLGWLDAPETFAPLTSEIEGFARRIREAGLRHVVLLGMGGSSLSAEVARDILGSAEGWPELRVLDDTDPAAVASVEDGVDLSRTLFLVASKSGTTAETLAFYRHFFARVAQAVGEDSAPGHFVAITDPGTPLAEEARERGFRKVFENPADIGGRYSALSYFGLVPLALLGADLSGFLERARAMRLCTDPAVPPSRDPAFRLGGLLGLAARRERDKVTFLFSDSLLPFGAWVEQLLAESSGKEGRGIVPVVDEPLQEIVSENGSEERAWTDRLFVEVRLRGDEARWDAFVGARRDAGHPIVQIELETPEELGAEFFRWEVATAVACAVLGVNAFDEPDVAESKRNTGELLERRLREGVLPEEEAGTTDPVGSAFGEHARGAAKPAEALRAFLRAGRAGEYLALLPYCRRTPARHRELQALRRCALERTGIATTLGYGPRYLHSTGQLHKGGPDSGRFVLLTFETDEAGPIPGEPYGFGELQRAQALGDWRALRERGRPALRLHLAGKPEEALGRLRRELAEATSREAAPVTG